MPKWRRGRKKRSKMTYKEYRMLVDSGLIKPVLINDQGGIYRSADGNTAYFIFFDSVNFEITLYEITKNSITVHDLMESKRYNFINLN